MMAAAANTQIIGSTGMRVRNEPKKHTATAV